MKKKDETLQYHKGDQVIFLTESYGRIQVDQGVVLMVKKAMPIKRWDGTVRTLPVVYVQFKSRWGDTYSKKFCAEYGQFQENPYPLWRLRLLKNGEMRNLEKRARHATKLHQVYLDKAKQIDVDVEQEAREWKYREADRRKEALPNGGMFIRNVVARMGFKRPQPD
jgi:hypothetical protein